MSMKIARYRSERGMMVRLLVTDYSNWVTLRTLWSMLDKRGFSISKETLQFHIDYLDGQGFIQARRARDLDAMSDDPTLSPDDIVMVKLSPKGLQLANGSVTDLEVTL